MFKELNGKKTPQWNLLAFGTHKKLASYNMKV